MATLHPILPGAWCVPSALQCLTGADYASVIHPALNRHGHARGLTDMVVGASMTATEATLRELGYAVRQTTISARHQLRWWAARSADRYPGRALLVATAGRDPHALVVQDGRVYDTFTPVGAPGADHPFARAQVRWCALVEKRT